MKIIALLLAVILCLTGQTLSVIADNGQGTVIIESDLGFSGIGEVTIVDIFIFSVSTATGEVIVVAPVLNLAEILIDLDPYYIDHIHESNYIPIPFEPVLLQIDLQLVDNTTDELTLILWHDDGTNMGAWVYQEMIYNSTSGRWETWLGGYPIGTYVFYYVTIFDGHNTLRTPIEGWNIMIWDYLDQDKPITKAKDDNLLFIFVVLLIIAIIFYKNRKKIKLK